MDDSLIRADREVDIALAEAKAVLGSYKGPKKTNMNDHLIKTERDMDQLIAAADSLFGSDENPKVSKSWKKKYEYQKRDEKLAKWDAFAEASALEDNKKMEGKCKRSCEGYGNGSEQGQAVGDVEHPRIPVEKVNYHIGLRLFGLEKNAEPVFDIPDEVLIPVPERLGEYLPSLYLG